MQLNSLGKFLKTWYPSLILMIIIFIMSSFPAAESDEQSGLIVNALTTAFPELGNVEFLVTIVRKTAHFTEYAILGFFTARALKLTNKSPWLAIPISVLYSASDEFHQTFVPGRSGELRDVLVDTAGASFGAAIYVLTHRKK